MRRKVRDVVVEGVPLDGLTPSPDPASPLAPTTWRPPAGVAETHISVVLFVGDRAYKVLKPLRTDFLDHSTATRRRHAAEREVELNRRVAPDVYLGVIEVGVGSAEAELVIVMRRLPDDRRLSGLLNREGGRACLRGVAKRVAGLHAAAPSSQEIRAAAAPAAVQKLWHDNLREIRRLAPGRGVGADRLETIGALADDYLRGRHPLIEARMAAGHVRDGHGDLQAGDIFCMPDGPRILDCLAFDDGLRHGDVIADAGFLAMDLERLGHPEAAERFMAWYREFSFEHHPRSLEHYYVAYRALVRTKVAALRAAQGGERTEAEAEIETEADRYLEVCESRLGRGRIRLVLVGGPPGVGKSTLATALSDATGAALLRSDELRKDLVGVAHASRAEALPGEGIYRAEVTTHVYDRLIERAERLLGLGENVILDASWSGEGHRAKARSAARRASAAIVELRCECPPDLADQRIRARLSDERRVSDAGLDVAKVMREAFEPWAASRPISTAAAHATALHAALALVGET